MDYIEDMQWYTSVESWECLHIPKQKPFYLGYSLLNSIKKSILINFVGQRHGLADKAIPDPGTQEFGTARGIRGQGDWTLADASAGSLQAGDSVGAVSWTTGSRQKSYVELSFQQYDS